MLTMMRSSSYGRIAVASPSSVFNRQTKPGDDSARAFTSSSRATNSAMTGESIGPSMRAMLSSARCGTAERGAAGLWGGGKRAPKLRAADHSVQRFHHPLLRLGGGGVGRPLLRGG